MSGDNNRKLCSSYLALIDRMQVECDHLSDAQTTLAGL